MERASRILNAKAQAALNRRGFVQGLSAGALVAALVRSRKAHAFFPLGGSASGGGSGGSFVAQSGYSASGTVANGGVLTITGPGGFGTKPVAAAPLLVMLVNPSDGFNPSALGRTSALYSAPTRLTFASTGGPGNGPYAAGTATASGDAGTQVAWTGAFDIDQWGSGSPALNDFSSTYRMERQVYRNFGAYNQAYGYAISSISWSGGTATVTTTAPVNVNGGSGTPFQTTIAGASVSGYNGVQSATVTGTNTFTYALATNPGGTANAGTYTAPMNLKVFRWWARNPDSLGSPEGYPDFYFNTANYSPVVEYGSGSTSEPIPYTPNPQSFYTYNPAQSNTDAFGGGSVGSPNATTFENWFAESWLTTANASDPGATPPLPDPTSFQFDWYVEGLNSNSPAFTLPLYTYQYNEYYVKGTTSGVDTGRMMRYYFWHMIAEQTTGLPSLPLGSNINYGPTIVDDSLCCVHARNNATLSDFTMTEFQIPSAWADTSVTMTLRQGRFAAGARTPVIITDSTGTEHYAGDVIWPS